MGESKCREPGCSATIIWAKTKGGGSIPLDKDSAVYYVVPETGLALRATGYYVSHFRTCRNPSKFTKAAKRPSTDPTTTL